MKIIKIKDIFKFLFASILRSLYLSTIILFLLIPVIEYRILLGVFYLFGYSIIILFIWLVLNNSIKN